jgi:hypothetical protein
MSRTFLTVVALLGMTTGPLAAQTGPTHIDNLRRMSLCELDRLFEGGAVGALPTGFVRGRVLYMADARFPYARASIASSAWKGKHFDEKGDFVNQWPGFQALHGGSETGVSWHDGKPCHVLSYPAGTPLFGNTRDEVREIAPGLYLARLYSTCPCPRFRGYFAIQTCCPR